MPDFSQFFSSSPFGSWAGPGQGPQPAPQQQVVPPGVLDAIRRMLGIDEPAATTQPNASGKVPSPDFTVPPTGLRPAPSDAFVPNLGAAKGLAAGAVEPFGQLGRLMTGQSQDKMADALGAAAGLAPIGPPGASKLVKQGVETALKDAPKAAGTLSDFITAYHGSPHDFDRFDLSKIGTGEGAQAYGHGLYFAENEGVARGYRERLSDRADAPPSILAGADKRPIDVYDVPGAVSSLRGMRNEVSHEQLKKEAQENLARAQSIKGQMRGSATKRAQAAVDWLNQNEGAHWTTNPEIGRMYQVAIKAPPEHFLDWDTKLRDMPPAVQDKLKSMGIDASGPDGGLIGSQIYRRFEDMAHAKGATKSYSDEARQGAQALREAGIPGIKYLDQGSRTAGTVSVKTPFRDAQLDDSPKIHERFFAHRFKTNGGNLDRTIAELKSDAARIPQDQDIKNALEFAQKPDHKFALSDARQTRNFVVFDDKLIDILKKYGIAGLGALPAMNAYHYQDKGN